MIKRSSNGGALSDILYSSFVYALLFNGWLIMFFIIPLVRLNSRGFLWIGIMGTATVFLSSLGYYLRRKHIIPFGHLRFWLTGHVYVATVGAFLALYHSQGKMNALIPVLTFVAMEVTVITGALARFALGKYASDVDRAVYDEIGDRDMLIYELLSTEKMRHWRSMHQCASAALLALVTVHILSVLYFGLRL